MKDRPPLVKGGFLTRPSHFLFGDDQIQLFKISIRRGGYSSRHKHIRKDNLFWVVSGRLLVIAYEADRHVEQVLTPESDPFTVRAHVEHRFKALDDDTTAFELYRAVPGQVIDAGDIVRADEGGGE